MWKQRVCVAAAIVVSTCGPWVGAHADPVSTDSDGKGTSTADTRSASVLVTAAAQEPLLQLAGEIAAKPGSGSGLAGTSIEDGSVLVVRWVGQPPAWLQEIQAGRPGQLIVVSANATQEHMKEAANRLASDLRAAGCESFTIAIETDGLTLGLPSSGVSGAGLASQVSGDTGVVIRVVMGSADVDNPSAYELGG